MGETVPTQDEYELSAEGIKDAVQSLVNLNYSLIEKNREIKAARESPARVEHQKIARLTQEREKIFFALEWGTYLMDKISPLATVAWKAEIQRLADERFNKLHPE